MGKQWLEPTEKENEARNKDLLMAKLVKAQNMLRIWGFPSVRGFNNRLNKYFVGRVSS